VCFSPATLAARQISFIRDTEIESTLRAFAVPLFEAAHLDSQAVRIYLVNDRQINAFVAGGQNLFFNTGLITRAENAGQVIGVIAHEIGHIEGGHLARMHDALERGTAESILSVVLGAAAAAAGRPDVGTAVIAGGQNVALRNFLHYTRTQEGAADSAAMRYLDATHQSARPLLDFFEILGGQELLSPTRQDPYLRTHPLTSDRISAMSAFVSRSPNSDVQPNPEYERLFVRIKAKLQAFLDDPAITLRRYRANDNRIEAQYARAIALHRANRFQESIEVIDLLLKDYPADPYFSELKGQLLFETAHPEEALQPYRMAVELIPDAPLIRIELARVLLALGEPKDISDAVGNLRIAVLREPNRPYAWRQFAIALGRDGQMGESALALAEEALLQGRKPEAKFQAGKAQKILPDSSPGWLRAQDILNAIENSQS